MLNLLKSVTSANGRDFLLRFLRDMNPLVQSASAAKQNERESKVCVHYLFMSTAKKQGKFDDSRQVYTGVK